MLLICLHSFVYLIVWIHGNGHPTYDPEGWMLRQNLIACNYEEVNATCTEDQNVLLRQNWYGIVSTLATIIIASTSLNCIRRKYFELFYYAHHLVLVLLLFVCLHYASAIICDRPPFEPRNHLSANRLIPCLPRVLSDLIPGLAIYVVDKSCRLMACRGEVLASIEVLTDDIVEIRVALAEEQRSRYAAGQYVFLNVPSISSLQWHPFSITSAPREGHIVVFHVKALGGPSSWTSSLLAAAKEISSDGTLSVKIDGFFGHNATSALLAKPRTAVVLVGGGVGVTPLLSILADLSEQPSTNVFLVWCTRTNKEFLAFAPRIAAAKTRLGERLHAHVAITRVDKTGVNQDWVAPDLMQRRVMSTPGTQDGAALGVEEIVSSLAHEAKSTPSHRYGLSYDGVKSDNDYPLMMPPAPPGILVRVVPSMRWFGLICCVSIVLMTLLYAEIKLLEEKGDLDREVYRILALLVPVLVVAAASFLFSAASQRRPVLWQGANPANSQGNEQTRALSLSALVPELLDDRIGKRLPLRSFFDGVAATLARDRSVVEVKVIACGATAQVTEARMQCERLNRAVAAEGCLWSFQEESWDW